MVKKKDKRTNNDLRNTTQETKDRVTLTSNVNVRAPERLAVPAPHVTSAMLLLDNTNIIDISSRAGS
jgi:hypothetical protein